MALAVSVPGGCVLKSEADLGIRQVISHHTLEASERLSLESHQLLPFSDGVNPRRTHHDVTSVQTHGLPRVVHPEPACASLVFIRHILWPISGSSMKTQMPSGQRAKNQGEGRGEQASLPMLVSTQRSLKRKVFSIDQCKE